jgi:hypothetical protein
MRDKTVFSDLKGAQNEKRQNSLQKITDFQRLPTTLYVHKNHIILSDMKENIPP